VFSTGIAQAGDSSGGVAATGTALAEGRDAADVAGVASGAVGVAGATRFFAFRAPARVAAAMAAALASGCDRSSVTSTATSSGFCGGGFIESSFA
jgi:hypothetical protein